MLKIAILLFLGTSLILGTPVTKEDPVYRLPSDKIIDPSTYNIEITPEIPTEEGQTTSSFTGKVIIDATVKKETNEIKLHANPSITFEEKDVSVVPFSGKPSSVTLVRNKDDPTEFFTLKVKDMLPVNNKIRITINYNGVMGDNMYGFYLSSYPEGDPPKTQ